VRYNSGRALQCDTNGSAPGSNRRSRTANTSVKYGSEMVSTGKEGTKLRVVVGRKATKKSDYTIPANDNVEGGEELLAAA
jgi:hypothetical protein